MASLNLLTNRIRFQEAMEIMLMIKYFDRHKFFLIHNTLKSDITFILNSLSLFLSLSLSHTRIYIYIYITEMTQIPFLFVLSLSPLTHTRVLLCILSFHSCVSIIQSNIIFNKTHCNETIDFLFCYK